MSHSADHSEKPTQPPLADLMSRYLRRQADAHAAGLTNPDASAEVVPFEAAPVQPVDPRLAWQEAVAAVAHLHAAADPTSWQPPPDWPGLVTAHEPAIALAFCVGNFPQLVRNLQPLLSGTPSAKLRPSAGRPVPAPALLSWADQVAKKNDPAQVLLAVAALRLGRHFDRAAELLKAAEAKVPAEWKAAWVNEEAALAWHRGKAKEAVALWQTLPESVPVLFNRGMAALFLDQPAEARACMTKAVAGLSEESAWHHLGRLYLALAEMRG